MLRRLRSIAKYTVIALTYKIKAAGSQRAGEIMVSMFFYVLCWLCVIAVWYVRSFKLDAHKPSPSYVTTLYSIVHRTGCHMTQQKKWQPVLCIVWSSYIWWVWLMSQVWVMVGIKWVVWWEVGVKSSRRIQCQKLLQEFFLLPLVFILCNYFIRYIGQVIIWLNGKNDGLFYVPYKVVT